MDKKTHILIILNLRGIFLLLFSLLIVNGNSQQYDYRNFGSSDGLAQPYVYSIIQDSKGYLWVGTADGLSCYNGFTIKSFTYRDSLAGNFITSAIDDGEFIWFGHRNGGITFYDGNEFKPVRSKEKHLSPVTCFGKSPDGQIWVSTLSDGLFRLIKGEIVFDSNIFSGQEPIYTFAFITDDELLFGTGTGLMHGKTAKTKGEEKMQPVKEIPASKIPCIRKMRDGSGFLVATENEGFFKISVENMVFSAEKIITNPQYDLNNVQSFCEDFRGDLWIGTFFKGLIKLVKGDEKGKNIVFFNKSRGFISDNVKTVYEDREGNIWSGNFGDGITRITPKLFTTLSFDKERYGSTIFAICSDKKYRWLGTEKGVIEIERGTGRVMRFYGTDHGLPEDTITAIYRSESNELWIGTDKNGLFRLNQDNGKIINYMLGNGSLENSVTSITGLGDQIWAGTKKGLCNINYITNIVKWYSISKGGLPHNSVNSLYLDSKKRLWVSTNSSIIAYITNDKVNKIPLSSGTGILTLGPVAEDSASRIWVGSKGNGLFIIESDSIFCLSTREGLMSDFCYSLTYDNRGYMWTGHIGGLSRIRTSDLTVKRILNTEGIKGDYQFKPNAILTDIDQTVLFGSDKGLVSYDPSMELPQSVPPVLSITSIRINDEETDHRKNRIILPPGKYKIRIDYFGASLKEPGLVAYQYKLDGYDSWSDITKTTNITYNRLSYGNYTFVLKASSGDGAVTVPAMSLSITIKKPLWRHWWFWIGSAAILALLVFLYVKRRLRKLMAEKMILEEKVRERTQEIQSQKTEIEKQRDMIEQKNNNITSSITYASKIQNAILPPLELLDALLPENFLFHIPKDIVSGDFYWIAEKDKKVIFAIADCTGHGVPGAFMSLLGITLLNEIVNVHGIISPDQIVTTLRERVVLSFLQSRKGYTTTDGMDIALCVLDFQLKKLQFAGAMNDLVYIRNGQRYVLKADHMDVSPADFNKEKFTLKELDYMDGDMVYLFSDGYQDQFGGDFDKKFLRPHFYNTLFEMSSMPVKSQRDFLEKKLKEWMKERSQTDDITVVGIRL